MTLHYCKNCTSTGYDCGPWNDEHEFFKSVYQTHKDHKGFQIGEPKLSGKENWEYTEIEKEATRIANQNIDRWFHELVVDLKGPDKICLINHKWKSVSQS